jgi:cell division protein FtsI/penicillin-binding protein 2
VRDELGVHPRSLKILQDAMLAETEDPEGTGHPAVVSGLRICGKTGTAQVMNERNQVIDDTVWFASFAPYEDPKYVVVVMVESGVSGGVVCAPIAHDIYAEIVKKEKMNASRSASAKEREILN